MSWHQIVEIGSMVALVALAAVGIDVVVSGLLRRRSIHRRLRFWL